MRPGLWYHSIVAVCLLAAPCAAQVRAWQDTVTLPTYVEGPPDPTPPLGAFEPDRAAYPYANRTNLTTNRFPQAWRRLNLENEYLACSFLPDLGGHLYSCTDKRSGRPMFHANPSIKKALIGLRGAWVSLGIEMNFPVGHSRDTVSPVNFGVEQKSDHASVWVGKTDRITGMEWLVEFSLRPGSDVLQQNVTLYNPTPVRHRYYWWNNAAVPLEADTRFVYPTRLWILHGKAVLDTWPISVDGTDLSVVANHKDGVGLFAYGTREPFFGAYQPSSRTALIHYADPAVVPGKKLWTWGTIADPGVRKSLSDNGSQYIEIQAGLFTTQEEFHFLGPRQARRFTEYWIPGRELGGVSRATADGILHMERRSANGKASLTIELDVTHAIRGARIRVSNGSETALEATADLSPAAPFARSVDSPAAGANYRFELRDAAGKLLLGHTEGEYDTVAPSAVKLGPIPEPSWTETDEKSLLARGEHNELNAMFAPGRFAEYDYRLGMEKFPNSLASKKAAGRLAVERKRFAAGARLLADVVAAAPDDAEAQYYFGIATAAEGGEEAARRAWAAARNDAEFGLPAAIETAASLARAGQTDAALDTVAQALAKQPDDLEAGRMQVALLRRAGKAEAARERAVYWRARNPIDPFLRYEHVQLGNADEELWPHLAGDAERVLDIADEYLKLGLCRDALPLLERSYAQPPANQIENGALLPQANPLVAYYRGYCRQKAGGNAAADFQKASSLPLDYVFPNRASSFAVLRAALASNGSDASAHWLLGLLYMNAEMVDEAVEEWQKARALRRDIPALNAVLSQTLQQFKHDTAAAAALRTLLGVSTAPKTRPAAPPPPETRPGNSPAEIASWALLRAAVGDLDRALAIFTSNNFPQEKQPREVRQAYIELQLQRLRALSQAKGGCATAIDGVFNFGNEEKRLVFTMYGFDEFIKTARFQYYLAMVEAACGDEKAARKRWSKLARATEDPASVNFVFPQLAAARLNEAEGRKKLEAASAELAKRLPSSAPESRGILFYSQGMALRGLGKEEEALGAFREGVRAAPQGESHYLNLLAQRETGR